MVGKLWQMKVSIRATFSAPISDLVSKRTDHCHVCQCVCALMNARWHCMAQCYTCSVLTWIKFLFTPPWPSLVYAGYLSAVTIPAGARSVMIRENPLIPNNYFGRSTLMSLRAHHTTPPKCSTVWGVGWIAGHASSFMFLQQNSNDNVPL